MKKAPERVRSGVLMCGFGSIVVFFERHAESNFRKKDLPILIIKGYLQRMQEFVHLFDRIVVLMMVSMNRTSFVHNTSSVILLSVYRIYP